MKTGGTNLERVLLWKSRILSPACAASTTRLPIIGTRRRFCFS